MRDNEIVHTINTRYCIDNTGIRISYQIYQVHSSTDKDKVNSIVVGLQYLSIGTGVNSRVLPVAETITIPPIIYTRGSLCREHIRYSVRFASTFDLPLVSPAVLSFVP